MFDQKLRIECNYIWGQRNDTDHAPILKYSFLIPLIEGYEIRIGWPEGWLRGRKSAEKLFWGNFKQHDTIFTEQEQNLSIPSLDWSGLVSTWNRFLNSYLNISYKIQKECSFSIEISVKISSNYPQPFPIHENNLPSSIWSSSFHFTTKNDWKQFIEKPISLTTSSFSNLCQIKKREHTYEIKRWTQWDMMGRWNKYNI